MKTTKITIWGVIILLLLAGILSSSCEEARTKSKDTPRTFSEIIKDGNLNDLKLTIYYMDFNFLTYSPLSIDDVINDSTVTKVVISGTRLEEHIDLLNQLIDTGLEPVEQEAYLDARLYYVFETETEGMFDVAMWGVQRDEAGDYDACIFVDGIAVNIDNIFYDVIIPFLPEDVAKELEKCETGV
jgi:hypothetical protein